MALYDPYRFTLEIACGGDPDKNDFSVWNISFCDGFRKSVYLGSDKKYGKLDLKKIYADVVAIREKQDRVEYERLKNKYETDSST